jgi:hypothetical protein
MDARKVREKEWDDVFQLRMPYNVESDHSATWKLLGLDHGS